MQESSSSNEPQTFGRISQGKVMKDVFLNWQGIEHYDFIPENGIINKTVTWR